MDTTINRGYQMPKSDGSDQMSPDLWRLTAVAVDADMAKALQFKTGETAVIEGVSPPVGTTKIEYKYTMTCQVDAGNTQGFFTSNWPAAFPNGITYIGLTCGDEVGGLTQVVVNRTAVTLSQLHGKAYSLNGAPMPAGTNLFINVHVVGW